MGCLNANNGYKHWFGNIHLSGFCNRECYFCIGQYMMGLDPLNNLNTFPLEGLDDFIEKCLEYNINEINVTGTNTDPLLFNYTKELKEKLIKKIPNLIFGIRTNGALSLQKKDVLKLYKKGSITICSFNKNIHKKMMGKGEPFKIKEWLQHYNHFTSLKINCVLGLENTVTKDFLDTLNILNNFGIKKVNFREPYGQPTIGDPMQENGFLSKENVLGMPIYKYKNISVCYWNVHYVEVESVNLYANGNVSITYPITKGYDNILGDVKPQNEFKRGRNVKQWLS